MNEKRKILVISRSSTVQMYMGVILGRINYRPVLVMTVGEGLLRAREDRCFLIVVDGDLPDDDRSSAAAALLGDPAVKDVPRLLLVTPESAPSSEIMSTEGWSAIVTKPIDDISLFYGLLRSFVDEPRITPRVPARMRVELEEQAPGRYLTSINISEGGIYLRTHMPLPEGTVVHLAFTLPYDSLQVRAAGVVVRTSPLGGELEAEPGMGISFSNIDGEARTRIRNFVQWSLIGDLEWEAALDSI